MTERNKRKQDYLPEADLYILWLLCDANKMFRKSRIVFGDLTALGSSEMLSVVITKNLSRAFGFELKDFELVRGKYAFDGFCADKYEKNKEFCEKHPDSTMAKALAKIHEGDFDFEDVEKANFRLNGYLEFIEFSPQISKKSKKTILDFMSRYLTDYVNDGLRPEKENFYEFNKQLLFTYGLLKKYIDQYGNSFVFEIAQLTVKPNEFPEQKESPYLPVHNLLALEAMKFIEIDQVWISDWEVNPEEERGTYKVRVKINQAMIDFFGDFDPKITYDFGEKTKDDSAVKTDDADAKLEFDGVTRTLFFANTSILISKQSESDPCKLMKTLFKDKNKVWANDEILEDWGYSFDDETSKNKVYQAGKAVNRIVAQDTKIKDFLDVSTKSVSINKKYLKT